jgi:hypothetical protein
MSTQYNQQQTIFALNSIANAPSGQHGTVDELQKYAQGLIKNVFNDSDVISLIGKWDLVWGTQVFQVPGSTVADNAMYVAQNANDSSEFVVAISGTNPISAYGWVIEDAKLIPTVPWPYKNDSSVPTGEIANGTSIGLDVLLNKLTDNEMNLSEFLASQVAQNSKPLSITVTGHSLGGALSPVVALALRDTQGCSTSWDPSSSASIAVQPSAGPTPGNEIWSKYYTDTLGKVTDRLWNAIDIVPHAWQLSMLQEIPSLYVPSIPESSLVKKLVKLAELNSTLAGNMQQICPSSKPLPGKVNTAANITVRELLSILEVLVANKIIDKLDLTKEEQDLMKTLIDSWIKHLNKQEDSSRSLHKGSLLFELENDGEKALESLWSGFKNFIDFLKQAAYQHTSAYPILLGTVAFEDRVAAIKESKT